MDSSVGIAAGKMKSSLSMTSLRADSPLGLIRRDREVRSEERTIPRSASSPGVTAAIDVLRERERLARRSPTAKDEFWEALRSHYNYLMDDGLIATCREASGELSWDDEDISPSYTFTEFIQHFNQLHDWLHKLQSLIVTDKTAVSESGLEEFQKALYKLKMFNEQAQLLGKHYPNMKDEINRRIILLNNKWDAVEQVMNPLKCQPSQDVVFQEVAHEMRCLRRWLRELEDRLHPLIICPSWTMQDLEDRFKDQQILQKEIESRGKYVSSLLKLCDQLGSSVCEEGKKPVLTWDAERVRRVAANLERRWHSIWLRSLEWQCLIEELIRKYKAGYFPGDGNLDLNFGDEPLRKYPRLSGDWDDKQPRKWQGGSLDIMDTQENVIADFDGSASSQLSGDPGLELGTTDIGIFCGENPLTSDKAVMVGTTGIDQLKAECGGSFGRFEIIQDVGYSSESSAHLSNDERQDFIRVYSYSPIHQGPALISEYKIREYTDCSLPGKMPCETYKTADSGIGSLSSQNVSSHSSSIFDKSPGISSWKWSDDDSLDIPVNCISVTPPSLFYKVTSIDSENGEDHNIRDSKLYSDREMPFTQLNKSQSVVKSDSDYNHNAPYPLSSEDEEINFTQKGIPKANAQNGVVRDVDLSTHESSAYVGSSTDHDNRSVETSDGKNSIPALRPPHGTLQNRDTIHRLVAQAEMLVREEKMVDVVQTSCRQVEHCRIGEKTCKTSRVQEWLQNCPTDSTTQGSDQRSDIILAETAGGVVDSSCDASGEYTTNESDSEGISSVDDLHSSIALSKSGTGSIETVVPVVEEDISKHQERAGSAEPPSQVKMRNKKRSSKDRPWSVTELYQLSSRLDLSPFSTSEGALNALLFPTSSPNKGLTFGSRSASFSVGMQKEMSPTARHKLSNSLGSPCHNAHRSDSGSDGLSPNSQFSQIRGSGGAQKLQSSDRVWRSVATRRRRSSSSQHTSSTSDCSPGIVQGSPSRRHRSSRSKSSRSSLSSSSTSRNLTYLRPKLPQVSAMPLKTGVQAIGLARSTPIQKQRTVQAPSENEQGLPQIEDQSSVSDQVWDGYEDAPYLSEPYSELAPDEDDIRKLTEFGDDYRAFMGSQSETSSQSGFKKSKSSVSKMPAGPAIFQPPCLPTSTLNNLEIPEMDSDSDIEDLQHILSQSSHALQFSSNILYRHRTQDSSAPLPSAEYAELLATCQTHLKCLQVVGQHLDSSLANLCQLQELILRWEMLQAEALDHQRLSQQLQALQKNDIAALKSRLDRLSEVADKTLQSFSTPDEVEDSISELQASLSTLQEIKDAMLAVNLQVRRVMTDAGLTTSPIKDDITELYQLWDDVYEQSGAQLTKVQTLQTKWKNLIEQTGELNQMLEGHMANENLSEEDNLDDTQSTVVMDTNTTESQLAELQRLVEELEPSLEGSQAWQSIKKQIECLDAHLTGNSCQPVPAASTSLQDVVQSNGGEKRTSVVAEPIAASRPEPRSSSRFWRVVRAALPIQVALVMLYCLACLLEPNCCDFVNNFNFSFSPQLRYIRGPPPV